MITVDDKIVGIWFLLVTKEQDWLAGISEVVPDEEYVLNYRFRYYNPESTGVWDGNKDKKYWYTGTIKGTKQTAIDGIRKVGRALELLGSVGDFQEVLNTSGLEKFLKEFQAQPWVYARAQKEEEDPAKQEKDEEFKKFMLNLGASE